MYLLKISVKRVVFLIQDPRTLFSPELELIASVPSVHLGL